MFLKMGLSNNMLQVFLEFLLVVLVCWRIAEAFNTLLATAVEQETSNLFICVFPRHSVGDTKVPFCLQSCVKPLKYAIAVNDLGTEYVHRYVGKEPSGLRFNKLFLNEDGKRYVILNNANTQF